jgi:hypothetical protein
MQPTPPDPSLIPGTRIYLGNAGDAYRLGYSLRHICVSRVVNVLGGSMPSEVLLAQLAKNDPKSEHVAKGKGKR